jgi:hypothetical protein
MRDDHPGRFSHFGPVGLQPIFRRYNQGEFRGGGSADPNSAEEVIGEVGLALVVVLGIVLAINMALVALHIT